MVFKILRNILSLLTGQVISKLISLGCVIFLARWLGVERFGRYGTVMAYLSLFAAFADFGMNTVTIRDVAQDYDRSDEYFSHVLLLRTFLTTVAYLFMLLLGGLSKADEFSLLFIASCGLMLFPEGIRKLGISMLSAYERMEIVAALDVFAIVFRYIPFFIAIFLGKSLHFAFTLLAVSWIGVAGVWLLITKKFCLHGWTSALRSHTLKHILYESFPFGVFFVLSVIYFKADIIMLSKMQGSTAVGFYDGAYKFIEAAMFIPVSIVNVLLPVMSRSVVTDKDSYSAVYLHSTRILALSILPVVIFVSFSAKEIILIVYGNAYLPSAPALSLLIWSLCIIFLNAPVGNVIATSKLMHAFLPYAIGNTLLNIILNLFLIPKYGFLGASFTTVCTECTGFALQLWFAHKVLGNASDILRILGKLVAAGALTSAIFALTRSYLMFPLNAVILFGTYVATLWLLRIIDHDDKQRCFEMFRALKAKRPVENNRD